MSATQRFRVAATGTGERLDRWLAQHLSKPRNQVRKWILDDRVTLNGRSTKPAAAVGEGDTVGWSPPAERADAGLTPEAGELAVIYEDADLAVLDKAAGLAVHPGAGRRRATLANYLLHRYPEIAGVGGPTRPGIVHRLDLDTTGVMVVARSEAAYLGLAEAFAQRTVRKTYLAIVYGTPRQERGEIDLPIGRHPRARQRMQVRRGGRSALTRYRTLASDSGVSSVELDLATGRTHQIRVHLKAIGHPLVGDPVYGEARWRNLPRQVQPPLKRFPRPALHAWRLAFSHPVTGKPVELEAPLPADIEGLWLAVTGRAWPQ